MFVQVGERRKHPAYKDLEEAPDGSLPAPCNGVMLRTNLFSPKAMLQFVPARDLMAYEKRESIPTLRYEPDEDALGRGRIPQETRVALYEKYTGAEEDGRCLCFNPGCRNRWLCLDPADIQVGGGGERRTLMHASHVEADSKMRQMVKDEGFNMRALDAIENLRPCCANCNGDMRRFNMFNFLDRVGRFMDAEYRAWKDWFDNL